MKRKASDSTNYKYDMYDTRRSKRTRYNPRAVMPVTPKRTPRKRTWKEFGRQVAGTAAASTLGFIGANTGGAMVAGRKTWDYLAPDLEMDVEEEDNMLPLLEAAGINPKNIMSKGAVTYGNRKFKNPSRSFYTPLQKFQANGMVYNKETFGKVVSPDCVYLGHSTYDQEQMSKTIALAIVRKLVKKAGYNPTTAKETIPFKDNIADSAGFKFQIVTENIETGALTSYDYETVNTDTLETIITANFNGQGFNFFDFINLIMAQNDTAAFTILSDVILYAKDRYDNILGEQSNYRLKASLNMKNEVLKVYSHSRLVVQNVTKGAASSSADDTAVDAQPLQGYFYQFAGGCPSSKQRGNYGISRLRSSGILLHRAQDLTPPEDFKEPPIPSTFNNCYKATKVGLEPGSMKRADITSNWTGFFNNLLFGSLTVKRGASLVFNTPGKSQMIALEEAMNTGSANLITTSYQCEKNIGVMLITSTKPICIAKHEEVVYNLE